MKKLCGKCGKEEVSSICRSCKVYLGQNCIYRIGEGYDLCEDCFNEKFRSGHKKKEAFNASPINANPISKKTNEDRISFAHPALKQCFEGIKQKIMELPNVKELKAQEWRNYYIIGNRSYFVCTKVLKNWVLLGIKTNPNFEDPKNICVPSRYYGSKKQFKLYPKGCIPRHIIGEKGYTDDIDYAMKLIKQSYEITKLS